MGLIKAVVKDIRGEALPGVTVSLTDETSGESLGTVEADDSGSTRFMVEQGRYIVQVDGIPEGTRQPQYPSVLQLLPNTEATEYVIQLESALSGDFIPAATQANRPVTSNETPDSDPNLPAE